MANCEVQAAFQHAIPQGYFSKYEVADLNTSCAQPAEARCQLRGLERGNHRDGATVREFGFCGPHLHAFQEVDHRLRALGWSSAIHGAPQPA